MAANGKNPRKRRKSVRTPYSTPWKVEAFAKYGRRRKRVLKRKKRG